MSFYFFFLISIFPLVHLSPLILQSLPCLDAFEKTFVRLGVSPLAIPFIAASKPESCFLHTVGTVPRRTVSPGLVEDPVRELSGITVLRKLFFSQ